MRDDPENIVRVAIERMRSDAVLREEKFKGRILYVISSLVLAGLIFFVSYDFIYQNPESSMQSDGGIVVQLKQDRDGHYYIKGIINGQKVNFLLDTGATSVSVPEHLAKELSMKRGRIVMLHTANGTVHGYDSYIETLSIGGIERRNVAAVISPGMTGDQILLGMSFLKRMSFTQADRVLTISE